MMTTGPGTAIMAACQCGALRTQRMVAWTTTILTSLPARRSRAAAAAHRRAARLATAAVRLAATATAATTVVHLILAVAMASGSLAATMTAATTVVLVILVLAAGHLRWLTTARVGCHRTSTRRARRQSMAAGVRCRLGEVRKAPVRRRYARNPRIAHRRAGGCSLAGQAARLLALSGVACRWEMPLCPGGPRQEAGTRRQRTGTMGLWGGELRSRRCAGATTRHLQAIWMTCPTVLPRGKP
mmetsp:Transcript_7581/g.19446  ORF Transcript_7581/g.19446 Transcript_7581/m.19446 type:complete len:242 (-) Transcript_7581:659-1384(-)